MSVIQVPFYVTDAAAATATNRYQAFGENYTITGVKLVNNGLIAAHNTNYAVITILGNNGSTPAFAWSTQDVAEGALAAAVAVSMAHKGSGLTRFSAGTSIKLAVTKAGGGSAPQLDCTIMLQLEPARTY